MCNRVYCNPSTESKLHCTCNLYTLVSQHTNIFLTAISKGNFLPMDVLARPHMPKCVFYGSIAEGVHYSLVPTSIMF